MDFGPLRLGLGAMNFGHAAHGCDEPTARAIVDVFLDRGGRLVDTADVYADKRSEEILGRALRGRRDRVLLATKAGYPTGEHPGARGLGRAHLRAALAASLRRLRTDHVDLFQVHVWDARTDLAETLGALDELVREGLARAVGCSNWTGWQLAEAAVLQRERGLVRFAACQLQYSLIVRDAELDVLRVAARHGVAALAWSPLASGLLAGKYGRDGGAPAGARLAVDAKGPRVWRRRLLSARAFDVVDAVAREAVALGTGAASLALAWLLGRPGVAAVLLGPRTVAHLEESLGAAALVVPDDVRARLDEVSRPAVPYPFDEADAAERVLYEDRE